MTDDLLGSYSHPDYCKGMFGCYMFYEGDVCCYVGRATCIYSRVKKRYKKYETFGAWNLSPHTVGMDYETAYSYMRLVEAYLIVVLDPLENIQRPDFMGMMRGEVGNIKHDAIRKMWWLLGDSFGIKRA